MYGNYWKKVKKYIQTRSCSQIRSHAQKYLNKLNKKYYGNKNNVNFDLNLKLSDDEIKRLVNKNKFNDKDMDDAELYILSIFKGNKDKEKYILDDQEENDVNSQIYKKAKKMNECEKIFLITKVNKKDKEKYLNENSESNKNNENSENENNSNELNENENNISENNKMIYENSIEENNRIKNDRKILKENILADKKI